MIEGIVNVYKPANYTSRDIVNIVRKIAGIKKVGHTGTLDPMATGVLPVCIGKATKAIEYFDLDLKKYLCTVKLGETSDTLDIWGNVQKTNIEKESIMEHLKDDKLEKILAEFKGKQLQLPPKYSALKVDGKRLYEYARAGADVNIKKRPVYIDDVNLIKIDQENLVFDFEVVCGKGTYIRSICRDIGEILGTGAVMTRLERIATGEFNIDSAVNVENIKTMTIEELERSVQPIGKTLDSLGILNINSEKKKYYLNGGKISYKDMKIIKEPKFKGKEKHIEGLEIFDNIYVVYDENEKLLGTAYFAEGKNVYKAHKVFESTN